MPGLVNTRAVYMCGPKPSSVDLMLLQLDRGEQKLLELFAELATCFIPPHWTSPRGKRNRQHLLMSTISQGHSSNILKVHWQLKADWMLREADRKCLLIEHHLEGKRNRQHLLMSTILQGHSSNILKVHYLSILCNPCSDPEKCQCRSHKPRQMDRQTLPNG